MIKEQVVKAYNFAKKKHSGQHRAFAKLPYFSHPKYVARLLEGFTKDEKIVIAGLLHDTLEDTDTSFEELNSKFGKEVADLVFEVTTIKSEKDKLGKKEYLKQKVSNMSNDALLIKLADRYHNVLFLDRDGGVPISFIKKYYTETIYVFEQLCERTLPTPHKILVENIFAVIHIIGFKFDLSKEGV